MNNDDPIPGRAVSPGALVSSADLGALHVQFVGVIGQEICDGRLPIGSTFTSDWLETRFGVSRSVVREGLRVLEALGMVAARRRIGLTVLPMSNWNVFDPQVIRWRLAGSERLAQLRSLTELRAAIEPAAARLAAVRATTDAASDLVGLAAKLFAAGRSGDSDGFLRLDLEFHTAILSMGGNEMFAHLHSPVDEVLTGRTAHGLMPQYPHPNALQLHLDVATSIQAGEPDRAADAMLAIMGQTIDEMRGIWEDDDERVLAVPAAPLTPH